MYLNSLLKYRTIASLALSLTRPGARRVFPSDARVFSLALFSFLSLPPKLISSSRSRRRCCFRALHNRYSRSLYLAKSLVVDVHSALPLSPSLYAFTYIPNNCILSLPSPSLPPSYLHIYAQREKGKGRLASAAAAKGAAQVSPTFKVEPRSPFISFSLSLTRSPSATAPRVFRLLSFPLARKAFISRECVSVCVRGKRSASLSLSLSTCGENCVTLYTAGIRGAFIT